MDELERAPTPQTARVRPLGGIRRSVVTAMLSIGLLVVGGVAVVNAADPSADPSASAAPTTETTPDASDDASGGTEGRTRGDCPEDGAAPDATAPADAAPADAA